MRNFLFGGAGGGSKIADIGLLVLRLVAGFGLAFGHGLGKFPPSERFIESVSRLGFPEPTIFAWAAALSELVGGICLAAGLLTRPASLAIAFTMGTAAFRSNAGEPFASKEKALLYMTIAVCFLIAGAGRYAVDALVRRRGRRG
jgi:putative oxidoreductase